MSSTAKAATSAGFAAIMRFNVGANTGLTDSVKYSSSVTGTPNGFGPPDGENALTTKNAVTPPAMKPVSKFRRNCFDMALCFGRE